MLKARYSSEFKIILPIKLRKEVNLKLDPIRCPEFTLKHEEKNRFKGKMIVEIDTPDMLEAIKLISQILDRILQILSIEYLVSKEFLDMVHSLV